MRSLSKARRLLSPLALLTAVAAAAPPRVARAEPVADPVTLQVEKSRLANGLEVILHEDHRTPIVTVDIWYHVGSKDEAPGKNGFAHLFEHVMFQGSKHVPEDAYFRYLERVGATDVNGSTNLDRTNYHETVPSNRLELALWLESDRMGFLLSHVDQLTFAGQRDVVKNERRQNYENAPYGLVNQYIRERLYPPGHPYHTLTIGTPKDLDNATLDDVKGFFRSWYVPNNATLVIAGDIDKAKTLSLVDKYFGPIVGRPTPPRNPVPKVAPAAEVRLDVAAGVELPRVYMAWPTAPGYAPGDAELDLVAHVLASGKTSRLYKRLVYDTQIAQDVSAVQISADLGSTFQIVATAQPGHTAEEMQKAIDDELNALFTKGIQDGELARAKTDSVSSLLFGIEGGSARADLINAYNQHAHDPAFLPKDLARYQSPGAAQVLDVAKAQLPLGKRIVALVTPVKGAPLAGELRGGK